MATEHGLMMDDWSTSSSSSSSFGEIAKFMAVAQRTLSMAKEAMGAAKLVMEAAQGGGPALRELVESTEDETMSEPDNNDEEDGEEPTGVKFDFYVPRTLRFPTTTTGETLSEGDSMLESTVREDDINDDKAGKDVKGDKNIEKVETILTIPDVPDVLLYDGDDEDDEDSEGEEDHDMDRSSCDNMRSQLPQVGPKNPQSTPHDEDPMLVEGIDYNREENVPRKTSLPREIQFPDNRTYGMKDLEKVWLEVEEECLLERFRPDKSPQASLGIGMF